MAAIVAPALADPEADFDFFLPFFLTWDSG